MSFDWQKQYVIGKATLKLKPYFYPTSKLSLDAKGFDIKSIKIEGSGQQLKYDYNGEILSINLDKTYTASQEYSLVIDYVAKPAESGGQGGVLQLHLTKVVFHQS